jgi:hypothetical protein
MYSERNIPCDECGTPVAEYIMPCDEYPIGAIRIVRKHHGRTDETVINVLDKICGALDCEPGELIVRVADKKRR